jgi:uncharacterized OB-fold protein
MSRVLGDGWALPGLDAWNRASFTSGALVLQKCRSCAHIQHPPEEVCEACQGCEFEDFVSAGEGRVESVAVAHHPVHPALKDHTPYAIVLVSLADAPGLLIAGNTVGSPPDTVRIGDKVQVVFEEVVDRKGGETYRIPQWKVVA